MKHQLSEAELERMFISSRFKKRNPISVFFAFVGLFLLFFIIVAYALNFSAYNQKLTWWYQDEFGTAPHNLVDAVSNYQSKTDTNKNASLPNISDNSIYIESINIKAPITFGVDNNESAVSANLKNGVIQIFGSGLPGEIGNVFITGHSSNFPWVDSRYNSVFALLGNVVVGDLVQIKFHDTNYAYRVKKVFIVNPSDASVMKASKDSALLTLMTCTPVGTNLKRLIVQSDQIIPTIPQYPGAESQSTQALPAGIH